jgi:hypothetical protein
LSDLPADGRGFVLAGWRLICIMLLTTSLQCGV